LSSEDSSEPEFARTVVVGSSCAGKTTFAAALSARLAVPHVQLDALHWLPDWVEREDEEFVQLVEAEISRERWSLDGNYAQVRERVWARASDIVWLDYSFACVWGRALRRTLRRCWTREELYSGNRESWRLSFGSTESILLWVLTSFRRLRRRYAELLGGGRHGAARVHRLRHPEEAAALLARLPRAAALPERER